MAHPYHHSLSSVKRWGGSVADYLPIHTWFDASKAHLPDFRHRALRHHAEGIFWAEEVFGVTITNADGHVIPVRWIGEQHVREDLGRIPTLQDWFSNLRSQHWMARGADRKVTEEGLECSAETTNTSSVEPPDGTQTTRDPGTPPHATHQGTHTPPE